jgi:hypothetical protein
MQIATLEKFVAEAIVFTLVVEVVTAAWMGIMAAVLLVQYALWGRMVLIVFNYFFLM